MTDPENDTVARDPSLARTPPPVEHSDTAERDPDVAASATMRLSYSAISDVGRVRKDNQDSGYAGPWLLTVCDGVGGAARGDIASSTAVSVLRRLDEAPAAVGGDALLTRVAGALHRAHDRISELVEEDPSISGTSTTATLAAFDGQVLGVGHVGDSRAYLWRQGEISQLTHDHTFVQGLIDEGRITEAESRVHPHRNLILKALDGVHDPAPDLFTVQLQEGDRVLLCSDGASGVLEDARLGEILGSGTPDHAAVELVRASLEAGSSDNVTCVVADVVAATDPAPEELRPLLVGAAAELPRQHSGGVAPTVGGPAPGPAAEPRTAPVPVAGGGHAPAASAEPIDVEAARYAPRPPQRFAWLRRSFAALVGVGVLWMLLAAAWHWSQQQFYVGEHEGVVTIFRGINADIPGIDLSHPYETTDIALDELSDYDANQVREGIEADDLAKAEQTVDNLAAQQGGG
ncbi:PP2C family protein-serine/threonine phosphatase [Nocardioides solisilvae]|uniref:PP2C family protein-serine/threonine phosphatase n=1 Tax=Nocardioides solisilvae TaxID=1542435 RepID=UPI001EF5134D|nr:protein phosphatase 2C domain-containing protein [Nocardioides solisilvae]